MASHLPIIDSKSNPSAVMVYRCLAASISAAYLGTL